MGKLSDFEKDIAGVLHKHGMDAYAKIPDYILATYVTTCIAALKSAKVAQAAHERVKNI